MKHILRNTLLVLAAMIGITVVAQTTVAPAQNTISTDTIIIASGELNAKVASVKLADINVTAQTILTEDFVASGGRLVNIAVMPSSQTANQAISALNTLRGVSYELLTTNGQMFIENNQRVIETWREKNGLTQEMLTKLSFVPISRMPTTIAQNEKTIMSPKDTSSNGTAGSSGGSSPNGTN